ncbi:glycoside hydrolase family 16 protein [uncultured Chitinophaga sp.]|uniref:glycoside hydrolase family 16 protein n=1 Tax=uncultured Chitinophaga sp. TaxID=339340 RepID=UPI0025EA71B3|nr:glycoside hydrolase family 16 protein [uncultured Chitinophaga sp.]
MKSILVVLMTAILPFSFYNCEPKEQDPPVSTNKVVNAAGQTIIQFSGYSWVVKTPAAQQGPHANWWSGDNVWVDAKGRLHLRLKKRNDTGRWEAAEIRSTINFGYGTYQWKLEGPVNALDKNIVLGLFNYSGNSRFDEMDIEFSRWGYPHAPILNYTVWPATGDTGITNVTYAKDFAMNGTYSTHRFKRTPTTIDFQSMHGFTDGNTNQFESKSWATPTSISTLSMPIHMNLWLFKPEGPSDGKSVEIIIHEFKYTPLP